MDYRTLNALPPEAFLDPSGFRTSYDDNPANVANGRAAAQYATGLQHATEYPRVGISASGTWFASDGPDGSHVTTYEGIGYHANTADLLRGLLAGTAEVVVYRHGYGVTSTTVIKARTGDPVRPTRPNIFA